MVPLGSLLASHLGAFGRPNRVKFAPRYNLRPHLKKWVSRNHCNTTAKINKMTQDESQDRLKMPSRRSQDGLEECFFALENRLRFCLVLGSILAPFWLPKCFPFAPFWRSKSIKKSIRNRTALKVAPRTLQERPRPSQDAPRSSPETLRTP